MATPPEMKLCNVSLPDNRLTKMAPVTKPNALQVKKKEYSVYLRPSLAARNGKRGPRHVQMVPKRM